MRYLKLTGLIALLLFVSLTAQSTLAEGPDPSFAGEVLCVPGQKSRPAGDCIHAGPAAFAAEMAKLGIALPLRQFPGERPPFELAYTNNSYARVETDWAPVFGSLEDARRGEPVLYQMEPGFEYVTYLETVETDGTRFYMLDYGIWMTETDLSRVSGASTFQGLVFQKTWQAPFGWVLFERESKRTPGFAADNFTGRSYSRYKVVQIFNVTEVEGEAWYMVGPQEWLEGRLVAAVFPLASPPEGVENGRWIEVNLEQQTLAVYENSRLVFATVIASGVYGQWTRPGLFQAYKKVENETMSGSFTLDRSDYYYLEGVPWTVYFDQARALHGTYWHNGFGVPQSRGCVNLSTGDARWVFNWIREGDWIYVWDPSGETPTDPALYGSGGA